jgi:phage recombination protein Bet
MTGIVAIAKKSIIGAMADRYGFDEPSFERVLRSTVIQPVKTGGATREATREELLVFLVVANEYGLNPFTREIFAFPRKDGAGLIPVVSIDGWLNLMNRHPQFDGVDVIPSTTFAPENSEHRRCFESITVRIFRKDRSRPIEATEYFDECYRKPTNYRDGGSSVGPWQTHPKRFLGHKSMIQGIRRAFGYSNIYDQDEAERIIEASSVAMLSPPSMPPILIDHQPALPVQAPPVQAPAIAVSQDIAISGGVIMPGDAAMPSGAPVVLNAIAATAQQQTIAQYIEERIAWVIAKGPKTQKEFTEIWTHPERPRFWRTLTDAEKASVLNAGTAARDALPNATISLQNKAFLNDISRSFNDETTEEGLNALFAARVKVAKDAGHISDAEIEHFFKPVLAEHIARVRLAAGPPPLDDEGVEDQVAAAPIGPSSEHDWFAEGGHAAQTGGSIMKLPGALREPGMEQFADQWRMGFREAIEGAQ